MTDPQWPTSVEEQDRGLRAKFPEFRLVADAGWMGIWEGTVDRSARPIAFASSISAAFFDGWHLANPYVSVTVIDPPIGADPRGTGEPPPHVYRLGHPPEFPRLCIYDPEDDDWWPERPSSKTSSHGRSNGFSSLKNGQITGEWKGGGRHPEMPDDHV